MSEDTQTRMAAVAAENVRKFGLKSPAERFKYMVDRGLINQQGEVTFRDEEPSASGRTRR